MNMNKVLLGVAAAGAVYLALRWREQGSAWTVPGSEQESMLRDQEMAFDATYSNAYINSPGKMYA